MDQSTANLAGFGIIVMVLSALFAIAMNTRKTRDMMEQQQKKDEEKNQED